MQPPLHNILKNNKQRKKTFHKKNLFKCYLNTTRLILECFKSLTSKSTTKFGLGSNYLLRVSFCIHQDLLYHKPVFQLTLAPQSQFTDSVIVSLSRSDRKDRSPYLKNAQLFFPGSSQTRHERQLCFTLKERNTPIAMLQHPGHCLPLGKWQSDRSITGVGENFGNLPIYSQVSQPLRA